MFNRNIRDVLKLAAAGKAKMVFNRRSAFVKATSDASTQKKLKLEQPGDGFLFGGKLSILCKALKDGGTVSFDYVFFFFDYIANVFSSADLQLGRQSQVRLRVRARHQRIRRGPIPGPRPRLRGARRRLERSGHEDGVLQGPGARRPGRRPGRQGGQEGLILRSFFVPVTFSL
jgi:hypothetical protein